MYKKAEFFIKKANAYNIFGETDNLENINKMEQTLHINFPRVLKEIYLHLPLIGIISAYHEFEEKSEWTYYQMQWMNSEEIISEMTETETGIEMGKEGYLAIGMDVLGGGDYFYIDLNDESLPLYQCYHDDMSLSKISNSIEHVFEFALVE